MDRIAIQPKVVWPGGQQCIQRRRVDRAAMWPKMALWTGLQYGLRWPGGQGCKTIKGGLVDRAAKQSKAKDGLVDRAAPLTKGNLVNTWLGGQTTIILPKAAW